MNDTEKGMVVVMIDKRIGKRIKQCRERLGLTQEEFAEKTGFTANYISTLERGASFPRCENLILLLNALEVSADAIFCDVLDHTTEYKATQLSNELGTLSVDAQNRILQIVDHIPLEKIGNPEYIEKCIEWLIEDEYTTGQIISIDGGWGIN